jgi:hypothetical protein
MSGWLASDRRRLVVGLLLTVLMLAPCVAAIASLAGRSWWPVGDFGAIDVLVRDVWSAHPPLTGLFSRPGWNHPGPLMFWFMSLVSVPAGGAPWATRIGGAALQGVALGWLAWLAWRRGLRMLLAAAAVTAATYYAAGPLLVRDPWNPNVPVAFFILFLFLTAFVATGSFRLLIAMVAVGSFAVQTHVSYTPLVSAGFAWAIGCTLLDASRARRGPPRWRSTVLVAAGVGAACWIGPAIDIALHWPGNLTKIVVYFAGREHTRIGLGPAARIMATEFHPLPPWAGGHESFTLFTGTVIGVPAWWLLVAIALLAGGALAARATGSRDDGRLVALAALMLVAGIVGISSADEPVGYHFAWRVTVAVFVVVASLWSITAFVAPRLPRMLRHVDAALAVGGVAWGLIALTVSIPPANSGGLASSMHRITQQLDHERLPHGTVLMRSTGDEFGSLYYGVIDQLNRLGVDARLDPTDSRLLGEQRTVTLAHAGALWYTTERGSYIGALLRLPGAHLIARTSPLRRAREAELSRLQSQLWDQLERTGHSDLIQFLDSPYIGFATAGIAGLDPRSVARIGQLDEAVSRSGGCRCAVVALSPNPKYPVEGLPTPR